MWKGKSAGKIDINHNTNQLTTTIKSVINSVLYSKFSNDHCGAHKTFLVNRYNCLELFAIKFEKMNLIGGGSSRNNIIGFLGQGERLKFLKVSEIGTYRRLYNRLSHIVVTIFKDSTTLQFIRSLRKTRITNVSRRRGRYTHQVFCYEYLTKYHHNIDGVDRVNQLWEHITVFSSKYHIESGTDVGTYVCVFFVY